LIIVAWRISSRQS